MARAAAVRTVFLMPGTFVPAEGKATLRRRQGSPEPGSRRCRRSQRVSAARTIRSGRIRTPDARPRRSQRRRVPAGSSRAISVPSSRRTRRPSSTSRSSAAPGPRTSSSRQRRPPATTSGCGTSVPARRRPARPRRSTSGPPAQRRGPAVGGQGGDRRDPPDDGQHAPADGVPAPPAAGHEPAQQLGDADQRAGVRLPLGLVGVQQPVAGRTTEDVGELPGQLVDVAQPEAQPLAHERRAEMGGVPGQQHAAGPPAVGHLGAERVLDRADELDRRRVDGRTAGPPAARACQVRRPSPPAPSGTPSGTGRR